MATLEDRLRRLGEHVEIELRALHLVDSGPKVVRPEISVRLIGDENRHVARRTVARRQNPRLSRIALTAAAASTAIVVGLAVIASRGANDGRTSGATPAEPTIASDVAPAVDAQSSAVSASGSGGDHGPYHWTDGDVLNSIFTLLGVAEPDEEGAAYAQPVPEDEIAKCMDDAGFRYQPVELLSDDPRWTMTPVEFAAEFGFGILAQPMGLISTELDPNASYVGALSDVRRVEYAGALQGCRSGDIGPTGERFLDAYTVVVNEYRDLVIADERVVDATQIWQACMAYAGLDFENPLQMRVAFLDDLELSGSELEQRFREEVTVATANVPCEADYRATVRAAATDRFGEFTSMLDEAVERGEAPEAQGMR